MFITKYGKKFLGLLAILVLAFVVASCTPGEGTSDAKKEAREKVNEVLANILFNKPEETVTNLEFAIREDNLLPGDDLENAVYAHKYGGTVEVQSSNPEVINLRWTQANVRGEEMEFMRDKDGNIIYVQRDANDKTYYIDAEGNRVNTSIKEGEPVPVVKGLTSTTIYKLVGGLKRPAFGTSNANVTITIKVNLDYEEEGEIKTYSNSKKIEFTVLAETTPVYQGTLAELKDEIMANYSAALEYPVNFNATVTAIHYRTGQFQVADNTDGIFVYKIIPGLQIGDFVNIQGKVTQYYSIPQVGKDINVTVLGTAVEPVVPTPITVEELSQRVVNSATGDSIGGKYFVAEGYFKYFVDREGKPNYHLVDTKGNDIQIYYNSHIVWEEENILDNYVDKYVRIKFNVYAYRSGSKTWQVSFNLTPNTLEEIEAPTVTDEEKVGYAYDLLKTTIKEYLWSEVVTLPTENTELGATFAFTVKEGDEAKMSISEGKLTFATVSENVSATLLVTITVGEVVEAYELPITIKPVVPLTVAQFVEKPLDADVVIAGKVVGWWDTTYYNFYIMDEAGDTILVYGNKVAIADGDYVVIKGKRSAYQGCPQVGNWSFISQTTGDATLPTSKGEKTVAELMAFTKDDANVPFNQYVTVFAKRAGNTLVDPQDPTKKIDVYADRTRLPAEGTVGTFKIYFYGFSSGGVPRIVFLGRTGEFVVTELTDAEKLAADKAELETLSGDIISGSTFNLVAAGKNGTTISWVADPANLIDEQGVVGVGLIEDATLTLTATLTIGSLTDTAVVTLNIKANFVYPTIAEARLLAANDAVITKGVVTSVIGNSAFIQDETAGIYLFSVSADFLSNLVVGNEITVIGVKDIYNQLHQIKNITSLEVLSTDNVVNPVVLDSLVLDEVKALQGKLISISGLTIKTIPTIKAGSSYNVIVTDGTSDLIVRVDKGIADFAEVKAHVENMVVGQPIIIVGAPVGQYANDAQIMVSKVDQIVVAELTDAEKLAAAVEALPGDLGNKDAVFTLPLVGSFGATITWIVKEGTAITIVDNVVTEVIRPAADGEDALVVLTATLTLGSEAPVTKDVTVTVPKEVESGELELAYDFDFGTAAATGYATNERTITNLVDNSDFKLFSKQTQTTTSTYDPHVDSQVLAAICPNSKATTDLDAFIMFQLNENIKKITFDFTWWSSSDAGRESQLVKLEVQVSENGTDWTSLGDIKSQLDSSQYNTVTFEGFNATYVRIYAEHSGTTNTSGQNVRVCVDNVKLYK